MAMMSVPFLRSWSWRTPVDETSNRTHVPRLYMPASVIVKRVGVPATHSGGVPYWKIAEVNARRVTVLVGTAWAVGRVARTRAWFEPIGTHAYGGPLPDRVGVEGDGQRSLGRAGPRRELSERRERLDGAVTDLVAPRGLYDRPGGYIGGESHRSGGLHAQGGCGPFAGVPRR